MRVLVSNDDGHFSAGIAALERAALGLSDDVWVVAPERKRSSMGHNVSLHEDFTMTKLGERRYACSGTPADCVIAALAWLFKDSARPDLVLSGINEGRNIGEDIAYSGTMAIAREASFWGIAAVAFSGPKSIDFSATATRDWLSQLVRRLGGNVGAWHRPDHWLSINLPAAVPALVRHAVPGRAKLPRSWKPIASMKVSQSCAILPPDRCRLWQTTNCRSSGADAGRFIACAGTIFLRWKSQHLTSSTPILPL